MATTKISALAALTTTDGAEELLINDGGTSKKVTIDNVLHDNSIRAEHYVDGSIATAHIADDAVTEDKLANAINTAIAANTAKTGITTSQASAITANTAKVTNATHTGDVTGATALTIAADAVTGAKIADNAIDSEHYTDGSIDTAHIGDDQVTADKLANSINTEIAANTAKTSNATHTGEVTGATALTIADNVVDEANLKVSNAPTNGYFLSAQSGDTGGMTWAEVDALPTQTSNSGKYLTTNGSAASWATLDTDANTTTKGLYEHEHTIDADYSITSGNNAMSAGPITISSGYSVTIPTGSTWVIV